MIFISNKDMEQDIIKKDEVINALQYGIDGKLKVIKDFVQILNVNKQDNIIMELQNEVINEFCNFFDDIEHLKNVNQGKKIEVESISRENENL